MENGKIMVLRVKISRNHCLIALALAFICLHPRPLGSEQVALTTYYPAPYGGYVGLLTTQQTVLARDNGNVGIGTASPAFKLDVNGDSNITGALRLTEDLDMPLPSRIMNLCKLRTYTNGGNEQCEAGYTVITWYGSGFAGCNNAGLLFLTPSPSGNDPKEGYNWAVHGDGSNCGGTMLCCRIGVN
jgi:hypothetical protein